MLNSTPSCAVAFPRDSKNATHTQRATTDATAIEQSNPKAASLQELRTQLRAQQTRNQSIKSETEKAAELRTELRWLVATIYKDDTEADQAEALEYALADPEDALTCYRAILAEGTA